MRFHRLAPQGGFAMIEVMVSAMLVAMISVGVLAGLDSAGATTGSNKARSIASGLAQDDQERIRSLSADDAAARRSETRTVDVAGVLYTVQSLIRPVADTGTGCGDGRLLKITSLVTWPKMNGVKTVTSDSLVAPRPGSFGAGEGGLIIQVRNRAGSPQPGIAVSIAGPKSDSDTTDENGCASFLYIPKGNYTATVSKAGYVASDGLASKAVTAPDGGVGKAVFDYDLAGQITANVVTFGAGGVQQADESTSLTMSHSSLPAPGTVSKAASPAAASISTGATLFPFTSAYSVFSGTCAGANPQNFAPATPASALLTAGGSATVTVVEPSVNVTVTGPTGAALAGATVKATDSTCGGALTFSGTSATNSSGKLPKPGMPYGNYSLCAAASVGSPLTLRHTAALVKANTVQAGTAAFTMQILTTSATGACP